MVTTYAYWKGYRVTAIDGYQTRYGVRSVAIHLHGIAGTILAFPDEIEIWCI